VAGNGPGYVAFIALLGESPGTVGSVRITCRSVTEGEVDVAPAAGLEVLRGADVVPWREFRWRHGQAHYSGLYWSSTTGGHVGYESRLELSRLLLADFDPQVVWIVSQPFLLEAVVAGQKRRHVPDFALVDRHGVISVVNVKPVSRLGNPKVAATLAWAEVALASRGWRHEVWSGAPQTVLANVRFLAGYRRRDRFDGEILDAALEAVGDGGSIGAAEVCCSSVGSPAAVRPALLHLVWSGVLRADLTCVLSGETLLERAA
jgi:hypothetical protein